ncbi:MAG: DUF2608 domain-containing protein [Proteobacteria bacterium]|nr:DUF2608 domain-containing protein [Pseudomonadota bacterium]
MFFLKKCRKAQYIFIVSVIGFSFIFNLKDVLSFNGDTGIREIKSFKQAQSTLQKLSANALVIFDLDETLVEERDPDLPAALTHAYLPELIKILQDHGIKTLALTDTKTFSQKRIFSDHEDWRHKRLEGLNIHFKKSFENFHIFKDLPCVDEGHPVLFKGILYSNRLPKGNVLSAFLDFVKSSFKPSEIVLFDDLLHNLKNVEMVAFQRQIKFRGFHYNKIRELRDRGYSDAEIQRHLLKNNPKGPLITYLLNHLGL